MVKVFWKFRTVGFRDYQQMDWNLKFSEISKFSANKNISIFVKVADKDVSSTKPASLNELKYNEYVLLTSLIIYKYKTNIKL